MNDWWVSAAPSGDSVAWNVLAVRLTLALLLGLAVAGLYRVTRGRSHRTATFPATIVLMAILIAAVTQVIGDNAARAFSLVGALSIVRFRTVVRDTKDTAFVIFAVVMGMAAGAGDWAVAVCGLIAAGSAAAMFRDRHPSAIRAPQAMDLTLRVGWSSEIEPRLLSVLGKYASEVAPLAVSTVRSGSAMELAYQLEMLPTASATALVSELNRTEGVQSIELKARSEPS